MIREHPLSLGPADIAALLSLLPETLPPSTHQHLLPGLTHRPPQRALDWAEAGQAPRWENHWRPESLEAWYVGRAEGAEAKGAPLASVVLELCDVGLSRGAPEGGGLARLRAEVWHLSRLLYAGLLDGIDPPTQQSAVPPGLSLSVITAAGPSPMTLVRWRALSPRALVRAVLERTPLAFIEDAAVLVRAIEALLLPLVRGPDDALLLAHQPGQGVSSSSLEAVLGEEVTDFLASQIAEARATRTALRAQRPPRRADDDDDREEDDEALAAADVACEVTLRAAVAVAQASKPNLPEAQRLLQEDAALFRLVLRCARAHDLATEPAGALDLLWSLVECLPLASEGAPRDEQAAVDALEARLVAAQYLDGYGLGGLPLSQYELFQVSHYQPRAACSIKPCCSLFTPEQPKKQHTHTQSEAPHPPLTPAQADFRALARWEPEPASAADGEGAGPGKRRLDLEIVARMCRHLAGLRGTNTSSQLTSERATQQSHCLPYQLHPTQAGSEAARAPDFWAEVGEDARALQQQAPEHGILAAVPPLHWAQALLYAALQGTFPPSCPPPLPPPPSRAVLAGAMAGLQIPAPALEEVVLQLVEDWATGAESGQDPGINRGLALLAAVPFSSPRMAREAKLLEAAQVRMGGCWCPRLHHHQPSSPARH